MNTTETYSKTVVSRKASTGATVEVAVVIRLGSVWVESRIDGVKDVAVLGPGHDLPAQIRDKGFAAKVGRVPLTADELIAVEAGIVAAQEVLATTPEGLRDEREELATRLDSLRSQEQEGRDAAWEHEDEQGAFRTTASLTARIESTRKALADFDAAHPEILAAIQAEQTASAERNLWN